MRPQRGRDTLTLDNSMSPEGLDGREPAGGSVKRKEWIPFVSLGVFMAVMNLTIAAFGFERIDRLETRMDRLEVRLDARMDRLEARMDRLEARMDRLEERLISLEQRVSRIEGVLLVRESPDGEALSEDGRPEEPKR
ncbi:MAG: hypothetical protein OYL41_04870 [Acidobacteriota bacterium]|nr:hypothetical protein [Acidobacteriota bacterium]